MKTTLAHVGDELDTIPALGLCGGSALYVLATVAGVWIALHVYEIIWWREARARTRALRVPASAS